MIRGSLWTDIYFFYSHPVTAHACAKIMKVPFKAIVCAMMVIKHACGDWVRVHESMSCHKQTIITMSVPVSRTNSSLPNFMALLTPIFCAYDHQSPLTMQAQTLAVYAKNA